jgi:choline-sulfatase
MNIILLNPDEMRAESVGCYGHPLVRTPNIDRLASQGVRFDQCHAQHTVCGPSRCSFLTGWYPHVRGHRTLFNPLQPDEPNLLRSLKEAGYYVYWDGAHNDCLAPETFPLSVSELRDTPGPWLSEGRLFPEDDPRSGTNLRPPTTYGPEESTDCRRIDRAIRFMEAYRRNGEDRPFVVFLPLLYPHEPYCAPSPWHDMYACEDVPPLRPPDLAGKPSYHSVKRDYFRHREAEELDPHIMRRIHAVYLGMISYSDWMLGRMMKYLDESGLAEDTALVYFSDHGDYAGDYGQMEKWPSALEDVLTRVPMVIRAPGAARGHVVEEPVELQDLTATIHALADVPLPYTQFGRSLLPQLRGAPGDPDRAVFAEGGYDGFPGRELHALEGHPPRDAAKKARVEAAGGVFRMGPKPRMQQERPDTVRRCAMIRTRTHKLVRRPHGAHELYDLGEDPLELDNLYEKDGHKEVRDALERQLLDWYVSTSDVVPLEEFPRDLPERYVTR